MKQDPKMAGKPDEMLAKIAKVKWEHSLKNKL
jgi:hypothetical protein